MHGPKLPANARNAYFHIPPNRYHLKTTRVAKSEVKVNSMVHREAYASSCDARSYEKFKVALQANSCPDPHKFARTPSSTVQNSPWSRHGKVPSQRWSPFKDRSVSKDPVPRGHSGLVFAMPMFARISSLSPPMRSSVEQILFVMHNPRKSRHSQPHITGDAANSHLPDTGQGFMVVRHLATSTWGSCIV